MPPSHTFNAEVRADVLMALFRIAKNAPTLKLKGRATFDHVSKSILNPLCGPEAPVEKRDAGEYQAALLYSDEIFSL
jgi:hypothetical protein